MKYKSTLTFIMTVALLSSFSSYGQKSEIVNILKSDFVQKQLISEGVDTSGGGHAIETSTGETILLDEALYGHVKLINIKKNEGYKKYTLPLLKKIEIIVPWFKNMFDRQIKRLKWRVNLKGLKLTDCPLPEAEVDGIIKNSKLKVVACQNTKSGVIDISGPEFIGKSIDFQGKVILHELIRTEAWYQGAPKENIYKLFSEIINITSIENLEIEMIDRFNKDIRNLGFGEYFSITDLIEINQDILRSMNRFDNNNCHGDFKNNAERKLYEDFYLNLYIAQRKVNMFSSQYISWKELVNSLLENKNSELCNAINLERSNLENKINSLESSIY